MSFADLRLTAAGARKGSLILVNREHPLQGELIPDLVPLEGGWPDQHLDRTAARMLAAAIEAGEGQEQLAEDTLRDHALLMDFFRKRDAAGAEHAMAIHMHHSIDVMGLSE